MKSIVVRQAFINYYTRNIMSSQDSNRLDREQQDISVALVEVERAFSKLKKRIVQVERDTQLRSQLKRQKQDLKQQHHNKTISEPIKAELRRIEQELETIEQNLESRLLKWKDIIEPFWQAVRFGGAGIIIGWILKSLV